MRRIFVDFSRFGRSRTVAATLFPEEREGLAVGVHVLVTGDDVNDVEAVVTEFRDGGREARLQLLG